MESKLNEIIIQVVAWEKEGLINSRKRDKMIIDARFEFKKVQSN